MRQIRFRFDGQPINETDTPAQVGQRQTCVSLLKCFSIRHVCFLKNRVNKKMLGL